MLVVVHSERCDACRDYISTVLKHRDEILDWGGRLMVAVREPAAFPGLDVVVDTEHLIPVNETGVLVADEWGEIYHTTEGHHVFPSANALAEWLRFIAIQCPECEQPEGPWREIQLH